MLKKSLITLVSCLLCAASATAVSASATTIDDVVETARRLGFPESIVQQGYNQYYADPDMYTEDDLDYAITYLYEYEAEIKSQLGITDVPTEPETPATDPTESTTSNEQQTTDTGSQNSGNNGNNSGSSSSGNSGTENNSSSTAIDRISEEEFLSMTLEEKREYISTLSPEEQQIFFSTLSPEELKNIVKQLPTDDKVEVMDTFVKAGESMGVKVTVNEITDDTISMTVKNPQGELLDVAAVGVIVEDTGYDYTGLFAFSGFLVLAAGGALWLVIRKCFGRNGEEAGNEQ